MYAVECGGSRRILVDRMCFDVGLGFESGAATLAGRASNGRVPRFLPAIVSSTQRGLCGKQR